MKQVLDKYILSVSVRDIRLLSRLSMTDINQVVDYCIDEIDGRPKSIYDFDNKQLSEAIVDTLLNSHREAVARDRIMRERRALAGSKGGSSRGKPKPSVKVDTPKPIAPKTEVKKSKPKAHAHIDIPPEWSELKIEAWNKWLAHKSERREFYKPVGIESLAETFTAVDELTLITSVQHSTGSNYAGLFFDKSKPKDNGIKADPEYRIPKPVRDGTTFW